MTVAAVVVDFVVRWVFVRSTSGMSGTEACVLVDLLFQRRMLFECFDMMDCSESVTAQHVDVAFSHPRVTKCEAREKP